MDQARAGGIGAMAEPSGSRPAARGSAASGLQRDEDVLRAHELVHAPGVALTTEAADLVAAEREARERLVAEAEDGRRGVSRHTMPEAIKRVRPAPRRISFPKGRAVRYG